MGVKGLQNYLCTKVTNGTDPINIGEEIEKWTMKHNGRKPTIIIDLKEFSHLIAQRDEVGIFIGGRHQLYIRFYSKFFRDLQAKHVNLVFFAPCNKLNDATDIFIPKREEEYMKYTDLLDQIDQRKPIRCILKKKNGNYPDRRAMRSVEYNLLKIVRKYGELYFNYFRHNQEIVQYANKNSSNVMAIISNDTDFLIFPGDFDFWSCNNINMKELTTIHYSRDALYANLNLNRQQLYMLAALSGNLYLPLDIVKRNFFPKLEQVGEKYSKFPDLSNYVRKLEMIPTADPNKCTFDLQKVGEDVFGSDVKPEEINTIENGLAIYNLDFTVRSDEKDFLKFAKTNNSFIYKLITDDIYRINDIMFIDYRECRSKTYAELVIPLLCKLLGILYKADRNKPDTRKFCMKYAHEEPYKPVDEIIIYPSLSIPNTFDLVFKDRNTNLDDTRWALLQWIFSLDGLQIREIQKLPEKYIAPLLTILYLLQQQEITEIEADAILLTEHDLRQEGCMPNSIRYPNCLDGHYVRLAHLYVKLYELICRCLQVCGLKKYADFILFDGAHFHNYLESFELSSEMYETLALPIKKLRIY